MPKSSPGATLLHNNRFCHTHRTTQHVVWYNHASHRADQADGRTPTVEDSMRQEVLTWQDVDKLIDELLPQMSGIFDSMLMITRGGLVPGGIIAEALDIRHVLTAAVRFPDMEEKMLAWPTFLQFPEDELLRGRRVLIVDDIWGSARTINTVRGRVEAAGAYPHVAVLHYKPAESLFKTKKPEYFAAVTENYIVYPWETHRKTVGTRMVEPMQG
jgi:hypoxanthine phosphoribosyltransferase